MPFMNDLPKWNSLPTVTCNTFSLSTAQALSFLERLKPNPLLSIDIRTEGVAYACQVNDIPELKQDYTGVHMDPVPDAGLHPCVMDHYSPRLSLHCALGLVVEASTMWNM